MVDVVRQAFVLSTTPDPFGAIQTLFRWAPIVLLVLLALGIVVVIWWSNASGEQQAAAIAISIAVVIVTVVLLVCLSKYGGLSTSRVIFTVAAGLGVSWLLYKKPTYVISTWETCIFVLLIAGCAVIYWRQWPPTTISVLSTAAIIVASTIAGLQAGRVGARSAEQSRLDHQRVRDAAHARAAEQAESDAAERELAQQRAEEAKRRDAEAQAKQKADRAEQERQEEQRKAEKLSRNLALAAEQRRIFDEQAEALRVADAADESMTPQHWVTREREVLMTVYNMAMREESPTNVLRIALECDLLPGQVWRTLVAMQRLDLVSIRSNADASEWWDKGIAITRSGEIEIHTIYLPIESGANVTYNKNDFNGPVTAGVIGSNASDNQIDMRSQSIDQAAVDSLINAIRQVSGSAENPVVAQQLTAQIEQLESPSQKHLAVERLIGISSVLGQVGLPILTAAEKVKALWS